ncbi:cyclic-AMP phosphodiesterase [Panus rudis PR-1116 ss-1]|nr:cyclic-AMP phosphodiesterase [Panus rudis PR-1116 ss-1]
MAVFDIMVLGCGGGPNEHNLSAYLLKPREQPWHEGIIALEAGSGVGALDAILRRNPTAFGRRPSEGPSNAASHYTAHEVYSWIRCFLITHGHLDHVNSLVLSAGSLKGPARRIYAARETLEDLESVFSDRCWPNLASWKDDDSENALVYSVLATDREYHSITKDVSVLPMPLSHGKTRTNTLYKSTAFFLRHTPSKQELLFFGDVEPDSIASTPLTHDVWRTAAPKIVAKTLSTIFIECSWPSGRQSDMLYGHLDPEHLCEELTALAKAVVHARQQQGSSTGSPGTQSPARKRQKTDEGSGRSASSGEPPITGVLKGVRVYIMHCKDDVRGRFDEPIHQVITDQVYKLVDDMQLGAEIIAVEQGMHICIGIRHYQTQRRGVLQTKADVNA